MTSACERRVDVVGVLRIDEEQDVAERDEPRVLHGARGEVRNGDQIELGVRVAHVEVVTELVDERCGDVQGEAGQAGSALRRDDADRKRLLAPLGDVELAHGEGDQVARQGG